MGNNKFSFSSTGS